MIIFILVHWHLAGFCQTFFLHRYAAHKMFSTSKFTERVFYFLTFISQGIFFTTPRAYAILHREHHANSDTEHDPHSPLFFKNAFKMSLASISGAIDHEKSFNQPDKPANGSFPEWPLLERISASWVTQVFFAAFYIMFYIEFATHWWMFLFLPLHFFMLIIQGSIVNWCGHKYGYVNFDNHDHSRNSHPVLATLFFGELLQNNHHRHPNSPNFGFKWFEIDLIYPIMLLFHYTGIIKLRKTRLKKDLNLYTPTVIVVKSEVIPTLAQQPVTV